MVSWAVPLLCLLSVGMVMATVLDEKEKVCTIVCHHVLMYGEPAITFCGCKLHGLQLEHADTSHEIHTDQFVCDYLCSVQMGGSACDCSIAIVPGRK